MGGGADGEPRPAFGCATPFSHSPPVDPDTSAAGITGTVVAVGDPNGNYENLSCLDGDAAEVLLKQ